MRPKRETLDGWGYLEGWGRRFLCEEAPNTGEDPPRESRWKALAALCMSSFIGVVLGDNAWLASLKILGALARASVTDLAMVRAATRTRGLVASTVVDAPKSIRAGSAGPWYPENSWGFRSGFGFPCNYPAPGFL